MDDKQLRRNVLDALEFEPSVNSASIGVAVDDGVVSLSGHVTRYMEKFAAERAVWDVRGVRAVADEIEVRYPGEKKTADDEIAKRAISILNWYALTPPGSVKVTVQRGCVVLTGEVDWQYQKRAAEDAVRKLSGVMAVVNNIKLKPVVQASDIKKQIEDALARHAKVEAAAIRVIVQDANKVVLEGNVDSWDEREAVENAAWSVIGVHSVDDRLTIVR
jgi:osmotically-inducible protein OsmY